MTDLRSISNDELESRIGELPVWDYDLLHELCRRADILQDGILKAFEEAEPEEAETVAYTAAKILGVQI